jgi:hypothetical protein
MDALEQTALAVVSALRVIQDTKFQNLRVAVIGGLARKHHNPTGRETQASRTTVTASLACQS